nr:transporter substrate-binding domain-containing protein [Chromobacterium sp. ASV5]
MKHAFLSGLCLLLAMTQTSVAAPNPACPNGPLKIGYYEFGVAYRDGKGYDVDLAHELARRLGCPIASEALFPRIRVLKLLESGGVDIGTSTIPSPERKAYAWIYPYNYSKNMVLLYSTVKARTLADLPKDPALRWGVIRGYRHSPEQDTFLARLARDNRTVVADDEDDLYRMLRSGVITAAFAHPLSYDRWMNTPAFQRHVIQLDLFPDSEAVAGGFVLSKKRFSEQSAELWHAELLKMYQDGTLRSLFRRYLSEDATRRIMQIPIQ